MSPFSCIPISLRLAVILNFSSGYALAAVYTPDSAAAYAVKHNPDLAAVRLGLDQARGRLLQAGGLENPELESEVRPNLAGREFSFGIELSRKFPINNRLRLEKAVSAFGVTLAEVEIAAAERKLTSEVRQIAVKLQSLQARQANIAKQQVAARDLAAAASRTVATGEAPPLEAAQLELEATQLAILILQGTSERAALTGALRPLLGCPASEPIQITGTLPAPVPGTLPVRPAGHPDYQAALAKAEAARRNVDLARASRWEDLTVGIGYERSHEDDAGVGLERDNIAVLRFSLPIPLKKHNAGHIEETIATAERTTLEAAAIAARLRADAAAAHNEMKAFSAIHKETTQQLLPQAEALETRFIQLQKKGQAALTDVLRARQQRLHLESAALDAKRDFHLAKIRYQAASGN